MRRLIPVLLSMSGAVHAHPNHPTGAIPPGHLLTEPDHLAILLIPLAIAGGLWLLRRRRKRRMLRIAKSPRQLD